MGPLLKLAAHGRLTQPEAAHELVRDPFVVALCESQEDCLCQIVGHLGLLHRLVALQWALLTDLHVSNPRNVDRHLLSIDSDRA